MPVTISTQMRGGTHNKLYGPEWGPWTTQQSTAHDMTVTATAKAMVVRSTKDDKADVMTTMITTTLMMNMTNKMSEKNDGDDDKMTMTTIT